MDETADDPAERGRNEGDSATRVEDMLVSLVRPPCLPLRRRLSPTEVFLRFRRRDQELISPGRAGSGDSATRRQ